VTPADDRRQQPATEADNEKERRRLYDTGVLAQSYAPQGVADLLNLSVEGRARARARWQAQPRSERIVLFVVIALELACLGVLGWGVARDDGSMVLAGAGAIVALMVGTVAVTIVSETRRARRADHQAPPRKRDSPVR
jgi:hypothetical protein